MSHSISLNSDLGVIVLRYRGQVAFTEIRNVFDELVRIPGFTPGLRLVADFQQCDSMLTGEEVGRLADYAETTDAQWGATKWVIIAARDLTFGLARMFITLTAAYQVETQVFRDARAADNWLGLGVELEEILALTPDGVDASETISGAIAHAITVPAPKLAPYRVATSAWLVGHKNPYSY